MGTNKAAKKAADQQRRQFEQQQLEMREANTLKGANVMDNVTDVQAGASADIADGLDNAIMKGMKKRKQAGAANPAAAAFM